MLLQHTTQFAQCFLQKYQPPVVIPLPGIHQSPTYLAHQRATALRQRNIFQCPALLPSPSAVRPDDATVELNPT